MQEGDRVTRVLVTGAEGQLGSRLVELGARRKTLRIVGLDQTDLDITNPSSIQKALSRHTPRRRRQRGCLHVGGPGRI